MPARRLKALEGSVLSHGNEGAFTNVYPLILGVKGCELTQAEQALFRLYPPVGFILFRRNIESPEQVCALVAALQSLVAPRRALILIDQEGGRVARLRPPHWRDYPCGSAYGALWRSFPQQAAAAAFLGARLIAEDLFALGINVDCLPVLDVPMPEADNVIGDRAYGDKVDVVTALGRAASEGLMAGGVLPIAKHIPGHGRALVDSHLALPRVEAARAALEEQDFLPFRALADLPMAMTAHVIYSAFDAHHPATTSAKVVEEVIRSWIGFNGLLMSDDLGMQALCGDFASRRDASLAAGCDVALHCSGDFDEMEQLTASCPLLTKEAEIRLHAVLAKLDQVLAQRVVLDQEQALARLNEWLQLASS